MADKTLRKQLVMQAVDACDRFVQATLHGKPVDVCSDDSEIEDILRFLFGLQAEVTVSASAPPDFGACGWRICVLRSDKILRLWESQSEIECTGEYSDLKCYWRPDFSAAFLDLAPDFSVVAHKEPFTGLTILCGRERLLVYVRPGSEPVFVRHIENLVGYIWRCAMWKAGYVDLHSALVRYRGCGMAIVGPKMAGKTSLAMHFLAHGAELLGSDMGEIALAEDGRLLAKAIPHMCRITPETITDNALLSRSIDANRRTNSCHRAGPAFSHGKFELFAPTLDDLFQRQVNINAMAIDFLVFPKFSRNTRVQQISAVPDDVAKSRLVESVRGDRPLADWLPFPEVMERKTREAPLLDALPEARIRAYQVEFGQEPSLNWKELDAVIETGEDPPQCSPSMPLHGAGTP